MIGAGNRLAKAEAWSTFLAGHAQDRDCTTDQVMERLLEEVLILEERACNNCRVNLNPNPNSLLTAILDL